MIGSLCDLGINTIPARALSKGTRPAAAEIAYTIWVGLALATQLLFNVSPVPAALRFHGSLVVVDNEMSLPPARCTSPFSAVSYATSLASVDVQWKKY